MKRGFILLLLTWVVAAVAVAQNVTVVSFRQDGDKVYISYTLDEAADVSVSISTDGGKTFSSPLVHVTGDVGAGVKPGNRVTTWDVLQERDKLVSTDVVFAVTAVGGKRSFTVNGVSFAMIGVLGGTFTMGATPEQQNPYDDEKPTHQVTLSSYWIGETEVTYALWRAVMYSNPSNWEVDNLPVERVSWNDCQEFIKKLNALTGLRFRLPTEAEWEFASRGGTKSRGYQYSGSNNLGDVAWYSGNSGSKTHPVATKAPNELGLYDMSGNVWEWCQDWYGKYNAEAQTNPTGPSSGSDRVIRGCSLFSIARGCRSANRGNDAPDYRDISLGLRLGLSQ